MRWTIVRPPVRKIVQELQGGEKMLSDLSVRLLERYGRGFSVPNLQNFRKFYLAYSTRFVTAANIQYPVGTKSAEGGIQYPAGIKSSETSIPHLAGGESKSNLVEQEISRPMGVESSESLIPSPLGRKLSSFQKGHPAGDESPQGFSPQLSWSHYRALMRVDNIEASDFVLL